MFEGRFGLLRGEIHTGLEQFDACAERGVKICRFYLGEQGPGFLVIVYLPPVLSRTHQ